MHSYEKLLHGYTKLKAMLALVAVAALAALPWVSPRPAPAAPAARRSQARAGKAKLVHGKAIAPSDAPWRVVKA